MEPSALKTPVKNGSEAFNGKPVAMRSPPNKKDSRKLFVGGLPADITEHEFRTFFEQFGEVVDSVVMFDRETQRSRGFGFVTFQSQEVATTLLNMREGEEETGAVMPDASMNAPNVGRLIMRGKTCEVKAAEPKESSRPNHRGYKNQGGPGMTNKRFANKMYPHGGYPPQVVPHGSPYHDPHYVAGPQYNMGSPTPYYHGYHPGMYHGGAAYHPAPMPYAPMGHTIPMHSYDGVQQAYTQSAFAAPMEGSHVPPYMDGAHEGYAYGPHVQMAQYPPHVGVNSHHHLTNPANGEFVASGNTSSAMHPAAPGLPTKDD